MINSNNYLSVAAFQGKIIEKSFAHNVETVLKQIEIAESKNIDVLCMPESFLHGYFETKKEALQHSIELDSTAYEKLLERFSNFSKTTLLLGLNEKQGDNVYNTVVVIENGKHLGQYRKAYTYMPYDYFTLGEEFPVFEKRGIKYGIIVCIDSTYYEPAHILALKGAQVLFCPMFNKVKNDAHMLNYLNRKSHFIARAFENEAWFISSDIVWEDDGQHVCPGSATILNKNGEVVCLSEPFTEMMITCDIPTTSLRNESWNKTHYRRLLGNPQLVQLMNEEYGLRTKRNRQIL